MTEYSVFYVFATAAATGIAAHLLLVPPAVLGRRFFILMSLVALVLLSLALVSAGLTTGYAHMVAAGLLVLYNTSLPAQPHLDPNLSASTRRADDSSPSPVAGHLATLALVVAVCAGAVGLVLDAQSIAAALAPDGLPPTYVSAALLGSALQVGSAIVAMTLGHWYLVARGLSFRPLRRLTRAVGVALLIRLAVTLTGVWLQSDVWSTRVAEMGWTSLFLADGVFVLSSWLFGIAVPLVLVRLTSGCLDVESNQSATGILYVIVAFVLLGELLSKHYLLSSGLAV